MPPDSEPVTSVPPAPPADAFLGKISPNVLAKVGHMPVMAPAYVPSGFVLADYQLDGSQFYSLLYRNPENLCFAIEYYRQPPPAENNNGFKIQTFESPVFGRDRELYYSASDVQPAVESRSPSQLFSQWLSQEDGSYRLAGAQTIGQNYPNQTPCQNVSLTEASKIITSIADLIAAPTE